MQKIGILLLILLMLIFPSSRTNKYNIVVKATTPIHAAAKKPIGLEKIQLNKFIKPIETPKRTEPAKPKYSEQDLFYLTAVIVQEAGSKECSDEIRQLVANVVINRTQHKDFQGSIYQVLTAKHQYGLMWKNGVHIPDNADIQIVEKCKKDALVILQGKRICPNNVVYQSEFKNLGDGVYKQFSTKNGIMYFNYKN